jgi:predicted amidohydrolase
MRSSRKLSDNVEATRQHLERCAREGAQVVVFPECSLTGYFDDEYMHNLKPKEVRAALDRIGQACKQYQVYAVVGAAVPDQGKLFNSALVFGPDGKQMERYDKIQLAERWPVGGDHLSVFCVAGVPCSVIICHDERYPELVRLPVLAGARVVFYISHESGIRQEHKINPYRAQIQARAVENTVFVVQANAPSNPDTTGSHGQSRIIDPDGQILQEASIFGEETVSASLAVRKATGRLAKLSVERGPFGDWWREGVRKVRMIGDPGHVRIAGIVLKWIRGDKQTNFQRAVPMIREAAANGAQFVVTTECFLDGYAIADKTIPLEEFRGLGEPIPTGSYFKRLQALAAELKIHLIAGMLEADGEERFNTAVVIDPAGTLVGKYRKQKLGHELLRVLPGKASDVHATSFGKVGVLICADRTEPSIVSRFKENGADFLICPSGGMFGPKTNDPIVQSRSRENKTTIVFVHPAEFLVTNPDGSIHDVQMVGDRLLVDKQSIGSAEDSNRICYLDLPVVKK